MENIHQVIGANLKKIRESKSLSLNDLSNITTVSKSMLGQIERGESSPSITILHKISNGLRIPIDMLMKEETTIFHKIPKRRASVQDDGNFRRFPVFAYDQNRDFELSRIEIDSQGASNQIELTSGASVYLTVFDGTLTVILGTEVILLTKGESLWFEVDQPFTYANETLIRTEFMELYYYQN